MKLRRRSLNFLTMFFDGGGGGGAGGGAAGGDAGGGAGGGGQGGGGGVPPVFNVREHTADDGSFKPDWHKAAGVSENLAKKFTRPEALARSYEQLETRINAKGIIKPGPNATQAEKDAFYTELGRPAKAEEYGFTKPDKLKIGDKEMAVPDHAWDAKRAANWQAKLFELGVPKDTAQKIMEAAVGESVTGLDMIQQATEQAQTKAKESLKTEWGADYDKNLGAAMRAAEQFGGAELRHHPALGNDPVLIKALAKIGLATGERPGAGTREQGGSNKLSAAEAKVEGQRLTKEIADRTRADRNWSTTPEAAQMKARKSEMFSIANPER